MLGKNVQHKDQGTHLVAKTAIQLTPVTQCVRSPSTMFRGAHWVPCLGLHVVISLDIRLLNGTIWPDDWLEKAPFFSLLNIEIWQSEQFNCIYLNTSKYIGFASRELKCGDTPTLTQNHTAWTRKWRLLGIMSSSLGHSKWRSGALITLKGYI